MSQTIRYDLPLDETEAPCPGDLLVGTRVAYRILDSRTVDSRIWDNRWSLEVKSLGDHESLPPLETLTDGSIWHMKRYGRGEGPYSPGNVGNR